MKKQIKLVKEKLSNQTTNPITNGFPLQCEWCGKTIRYTLWEIDDKKKREPYPAPDSPAYFIPCPFCKDGYLFSTESDEFLEDFLSCTCDDCDED